MRDSAAISELEDSHELVWVELTSCMLRSQDIFVGTR